MFWLRQHARFVLAENLITMARYKVVEAIANCFRQRLSYTGDSPDSAQRSKRINNPICTRQQTLGSLPVIKDHVEGVEVERVGPVSP